MMVQMIWSIQGRWNCEGKRENDRRDRVQAAQPRADRGSGEREGPARGPDQAWQAGSGAGIPSRYACRLAPRLPEAPDGAGAWRRPHRAHRGGLDAERASGLLVDTCACLWLTHDDPMSPAELRAIEDAT